MLETYYCIHCNKYFEYEKTLTWNGKEKDNTAKCPKCQSMQAVIKHNHPLTKILEKKRALLMMMMYLLLCVGVVSAFADDTTLIPQLVFHDTVSVANPNSSSLSWELSVTNTELVLKTLKDLGYCSITFDDFIAFQNGTKQLCDRPVILVFDDGRKSTYTLAYPLMKKYGFVGNMAIIAGRVGISSAFMSWDEINFLEIEANWSGVCHSVDHISMTSLNTTNAEIQYVRCAEILYNNTGNKPNIFVFPYYSVNDNALQQCLQYYTGCATNTSQGYMMKNIPLSKGFYRTTLDGLQRENNVLTALISRLPYKTVSENITIIRNPSFNTISEWNFYTNGKAVTTYNNEATIKIVAKGTNTQLYQYNLPIKSDTEYTLSFNAKADKSNSMNIRLLKHTSPYSIYGLNWDIPLTTSWNNYVKEFKTTSNTLSDARLMFWLANGVVGETYHIDDVILKEKEPTPKDCEYTITANSTEIILTIKTIGCNVIIK